MMDRSPKTAVGDPGCDLGDAEFAGAAAIRSERLAFAFCQLTRPAGFKRVVVHQRRLQPYDPSTQASGDEGSPRGFSGP